MKSSGLALRLVPGVNASTVVAIDWESEIGAAFVESPDALALDAIAAQIKKVHLHLL